MAQKSLVNQKSTIPSARDELKHIAARMLRLREIVGQDCFTRA